MADRYFSPTLELDLANDVLEGDEARHLAKVLRGKAGDQIELFNGRGLRADAKITLVGKRHVEVAILEHNLQPKPAGLVLAVAVPKGDRSLWMIEKCAELGVLQMIPLICQRGIASAGDAKRERFDRRILEVCKQCRRDWLMEVVDPMPLPATLDSLPPGAVGWMLDPSGEAASGRCDWAAVGPEGGFTPEEIAAAKNAAWKVVRLPGHILRVETAAVAVAALSMFSQEQTQEQTRPA